MTHNMRICKTGATLGLRAKHTRGFIQHTQYTQAASRNTHTHIYTNPHPPTPRPTSTRIHTHTNTHARTHTRTHAHTHAHTHTHTYTHRVAAKLAQLHGQVFKAWQVGILHTREQRADLLCIQRPAGVCTHINSYVTKRGQAGWHSSHP